MPVVYLVEQGTTLRKEGETLVVVREGETLARVPLLRVEQVVVFGNVQLTTPVLGTLLRRGIDTVFLSVEGRYYGRLLARESRFGELRLRQMEAAREHSRRLALARRFAWGKVANERTMLLRYARDRKVESLDGAVRGMAESLERLERAEHLGGVIAAEGYGTALYFRAFREMLRQELGFTTRARRPPPDPVNALLSFGYTLLLHSVQAAVQTVGLDPYIGFLHALVYSRPALPLDLMEEFRPVIVDSIVLRLVNTRRLREEHFSRLVEGPGVYLTEEGKRRFLEQYEERLNTKILYPRTGEQVTYRRCLELQARQLARVLLSREQDYRAFVVK
jgi:CRISPR-associated protein Cas1